MDAGIIGTVAGSILGFLASLLPDIFSIIKKTKVPSTPSAPLPQFNTNDLNGQVTDGETVVSPRPTTFHPRRLQPHYRPAEKDGDFEFLDFLRASVRPVLTYAFFGLFAFVKLIALWHAYRVEHMKTAELLPILWDEGTEALFAAVLSFWFGARAMMRIRQQEK